LLSILDVFLYCTLGEYNFLLPVVWCSGDKVRVKLSLCTP